MNADKLGFYVSQVEVTENDIRLQFTNINGEKLEANLGMRVSAFSGQPEIHLIRHYVDKGSTSWFDGSMSWGEWLGKHHIHSSHHLV
jgi:mannose-1-phosphate guanylyltransferase